jgi:hypothetical protein
MIPDRAPDTIRPTAPADPPVCATCGRSRKTYLTLSEAVRLVGYGRSTSMCCLLTDHPRSAYEPPA